MRHLWNGNKSGQASALMVMTPIIPGCEDGLRADLEKLHNAGSPLARSTRTHFARWVIVPNFVSDPEQPRRDDLNCQYLVFTSNFDGPLGSYLDELCRQLAPEAPRIWGRCIGCPEPAAGAALAAYLLHNKINTGFFVAAYPDATVAEVTRSLGTRAQMIEFAVRAQTMDSVELQRAFIEEFKI